MQHQAPSFPLRFEDILDGYFPLSISIHDMMRRRGFHQAEIDLRFAPIIHVVGLAPDAPVPLNINHGRAGMIHKAGLLVSVIGREIHICGEARWRWLDGGQEDTALNPSIRLAEPVFITGVASSIPSQRGEAWGTIKSIH